MDTNGAAFLHMTDLDLSKLTDDELDRLDRAHPRDFAHPLAAANDYPNAIFAERQRRQQAWLRGKSSL
jgi:hypothetical protein